LVKAAPGVKTEPSGMEISLIKEARSQAAVGGTETVEGARVNVGKLAAVFVAGGGGSVGVLNGVACVDMACTVRAAAVNTAFGSSVAGAREGRLQAASIKIIASKREMKRMLFNILFS
jgi:hypothetical protein